MTDSISSDEDYEYLKRLNNTDYDYIEPHYFDPHHGYRFIGYKSAIARDFINWERNNLTELAAYRLGNKYEKGYTVNEGMIYKFKEFLRQDPPKKLKDI